jgi:hypothetical protein
MFGNGWQKGACGLSMSVLALGAAVGPSRRMQKLENLILGAWTLSFELKLGLGKFLRASQIMDQLQSATLRGLQNVVSSS